MEETEALIAASLRRALPDALIVITTNRRWRNWPI
jgi:hypothetical protein